MNLIGAISAPGTILAPAAITTPRQVGLRRALGWAWVVAILVIAMFSIEVLSPQALVGHAAQGAQNLTLAATAETRGGDLYPGASDAVKVVVSNPNDFVVTVIRIAGNGPITSAANAACDASTGVRFIDTEVGSHNAIAAGGDLVLTLAGAASMSNDSSTSCQGATFVIPVTVTATA